MDKEEDSELPRLERPVKLFRASHTPSWIAIRKQDVLAKVRPSTPL